MRFFEGLVNTPLAAATGWALVHSLWQGAIVAAALGAVLMLVRSPKWRYAAGCVAMMMMAGAFGITIARAIRPDVLARPIPAVPGLHWKTSVVQAAGSLQTNLAAAVPWLAPFWVAGVSIFYLGQAAAWISVFRMRRRGVCSAPAAWQETLTRLSARLRVTRPVVLLESCLTDAPVVLGHLRPIILAPLGMLAGLPAAQVEAILMHELAHIRRCDYLVNACQRLVEGLLFYHPAVWWIGTVVRAERENCCDDVAALASGSARGYAEALAALEEKRCSSPSLAVASTGGSLMKRIRRLLYPSGPYGAWTPVAAALVLMVTAAVALTAWQAAPAENGTRGSSAAAQSSAAWLNRDVTYIIADQERAAFLKLGSESEREKFIEQFWERRNPTPGSAENAFKKEHYRRIAYANTHFRMPSGAAGWESDRGHIYIVYGPPDEIEAHPAGMAQQYANEVWMYHHVDGIGDRVTVTFVDRTGRQDYRLAPGKGY